VACGRQAGDTGMGQGARVHSPGGGLDRGQSAAQRRRGHPARRPPPGRRTPARRAQRRGMDRPSRPTALSEVVRSGIARVAGLAPDVVLGHDTQVSGFQEGRAEFFEPRPEGCFSGNGVGSSGARHPSIIPRIIGVPAHQPGSGPAPLGARRPRSTAPSRRRRPGPTAPMKDSSAPLNPSSLLISNSRRVPGCADGRLLCGFGPG
jgi:hypothetical protein